MSTQFTPRTDAEREQWKAMCKAVLSHYANMRGGTFDEAISAIVAPVPRVLRSVTLSDGYTYRVKDGELQYRRETQEAWWHTNDFPMTRANIALVHDLYEHPDEPAPAAPALTRQQCVEALVAMGAEVYENASTWSDAAVIVAPGRTAIILPREVTP